MPHVILVGKEEFHTSADRLRGRELSSQAEEARVKTIRVRIPRLPYFRCVAVLFACVALGSPLFAQTAPIVQRLSPNTVFYVEWRGNSFLAGAKQKNHVLQLLHDPAFAPMLTEIAGQMQRGTLKNLGPAAAFVLPDLASFLDNAVVFGIVTNPDAMKTAAPDKSASPFATFLVYDSTGKADLIQKWKALSALSSKTPVDVTKYDFGETSVEVRTTGKNASYSAQAGNYFVTSDQKQIVEDLITRFRSADAPATSVAQIAEYGQMRKYVGSDAALEVFARIPDMSQWNSADKNAKSMIQLSKNLHLEKIHVMAGALNFDGEETHIRGAVLGDTSPGGLFDLAGASSAAFQTQTVAESGPVFSMTRMNLSAMYQLLHDAIVGNLAPDQSANVTAMEGAAQSFLGMSIADALKLFTGEFASTSVYAEDGTPEQIFAATIQKPDAVLRVLRAVIGTMIVGEDSSGSTTYLDLASPYTDPSTHQRRRKFYYVAVTPQMILAAPRKAMLRQAMQRLSPEAADPPPTGVFANPAYAQLRARLPEKLSGLSGADIGQIPLDKLAQSLASQAPRSGNQQPPDMSHLKLDVISRYIHITLSGWWKDSNGVYFDSYIQ